MEGSSTLGRQLHTPPNLEFQASNTTNSNVQFSNQLRKPNVMRNGHPKKLLNKENN